MKKYFLFPFFALFIFGSNSALLLAQQAPFQNTHRPTRVVRTYMAPIRGCVSHEAYVPSAGKVLQPNQEMLLPLGVKPCYRSTFSERLKLSKINELYLFGEERPEIPPPAEVILPFNQNDGAQWSVASTGPGCVAIDHTFLAEENGMMEQVVLMHAAVEGETTLIFSYKKNGAMSPVKQTSYQAQIIPSARPQKPHAGMEQ